MGERQAHDAGVKVRVKRTAVVVSRVAWCKWAASSHR